MTNKSPLVSVILPTYNGKKERISESIESVLNQTFTDFEFIIINDCSTNDIEKTIKDYEKKDSRIIYVKNEENLKQTKTMSKWIALSKGKYIARIDDDDIRADKTQLQQQIDFMEKNTDYWLVWTNADIIDQNWKFLYRLNRPGTDKDLRDNMLVWNWFIQSSIVIRKETLNKVWWYDPKWNLVEDYEMWMRIGTVSKMMNLLNILSKVRINPNSVTRKNYNKQKRMTIRLILKYCKYYPKKHLVKWLCFHIWELIIPQKITRYILNKIRNIKV